MYVYDAQRGHTWFGQIVMFVRKFFLVLYIQDIHMQYFSLVFRKYPVHSLICKFCISTGETKSHLSSVNGIFCQMSILI